MKQEIQFKERDIPNMSALARTIEENVLTYLKLGHRDISVSMRCLSPANDSRSAWTITITLDDINAAPLIGSRRPWRFGDELNPPKQESQS